MVFYSHTNPKRKLINHLQEVAEYSIRYGDESLTGIHKIIGYAHDFGKYTTYFQDDRLFKKNHGEIRPITPTCQLFSLSFLCLKTTSCPNRCFHY